MRACADNFLMKHRVNIIGTAFKGRNFHTSFAKCLRNCTCDGNLAAAAVCAANKYSFHRCTPFIINTGFSAARIVCEPILLVLVTAIWTISGTISKSFKAFTEASKVSKETTVITMSALGFFCIQYR